ncbi:methyltransferase domain-containing protein [Catenuloplanes atrovinosus]|uniref:TPR repeat methyltransferase n=1 Tax=Catenuloplanes atrovinosus TaxID=137266 RepID=A0AAE3YT00_9ACTN|nr:methyltransferase domain-containing protein [Catenuloplanes atrovinosus]MDR7279334.1 putative TPR repeat methyltransferase [Catenuloplanes atrovinosus]
MFQNAEAVEKYETVTYAPDSYGSAINERQRAYLRRLITRSFPVRRPVQHDFACGTGRAIRLLHGAVRGAHGYDTSAEMLAKAAEVGTAARLHRIAEDGPVPVPAREDGPALVTSFRLLLNVDDSVRHRLLAFAARALPDRDAGLLVVENHGNRRSLRHLAARRRSGRRWFAELSHAEVVALLAEHGFEVVERRGFSMFPQSAYERRGVRTVARLVDRFATRLPSLSGVAVNVLYVARRHT